MIASLKYNDQLGVEVSNHSIELNSLICRLQKGDRKAQAECYNLFVGKMYTVAMRYTSSKDDSKEVINTAFLNVFKSVKSFDSKGSFEGWIRTIVKRASIDHCRKYIYNKNFEYEVKEFDAVVYNDAINQLDAQGFLRMMVQIPKTSRLVFNLFAIEGYSHKEISKELNISEGTSKWHLSNARKRLVQIIQLENNGHVR